MTYGGITLFDLATVCLAIDHLHTKTHELAGYLLLGRESFEAFGQDIHGT